MEYEIDRYLFFDIECAKTNRRQQQGVAIYSFGYVITDTQFNIIKRDDILINPKSEWDWYVAKNLLAYDKKVFRQCGSFADHYPSIREIINYPKQIIFGHSVQHDARFLQSEFKRYHLPCLNFYFYDNEILYANFCHAKENQGYGLRKICEDLNYQMESEKHRSDEDAYVTMLSVKHMCEKDQLDAIQLIKKSPECEGSLINYVITGCQRQKLMLTDAIAKYPDNPAKLYKKYFRKFLHHLKPQLVECPKLSGQKVTISFSYRSQNFVELVKIVQLINNHGGHYSHKIEKCHYFVIDDTATELHQEDQAQLNFAQKNKIKIFSKDSLLAFLQVTADELAQMPIPEMDLNQEIVK